MRTSSHPYCFSLSSTLLSALVCCRLLLCVYSHGFSETSRPVVLLALSSASPGSFIRGRLSPPLASLFCVAAGSSLSVVQREGERQLACSDSTKEGERDRAEIKVATESGAVCVCLFAVGSAARREPGCSLACWLTGSGLFVVLFPSLSLSLRSIPRVCSLLPAAARLAAAQLDFRCLRSRLLL